MGEIWEIKPPKEWGPDVTYRVHFYEADDIYEDKDFWEAYAEVVDDTADWYGFDDLPEY